MNPTLKINGVWNNPHAIEVTESIIDQHWSLIEVGPSTELRASRSFVKQMNYSKAIVTNCRFFSLFKKTRQCKFKSVDNGFQQTVNSVSNKGLGFVGIFVHSTRSSRQRFYYIKQMGGLRPRSSWCENFRRNNLHTVLVIDLVVEKWIYQLKDTTATKGCKKLRQLCCCYTSFWRSGTPVNDNLWILWPDSGFIIGQVTH